MSTEVKNVKLIVGNVGMPGAPILHLTLAIAGGIVGGLAEITQAIQGPNSDHKFPVTGKVYHTGLGKDTLLISLEGEFLICVPPPAIGCYIAKFHSSLALDPSTFAGTGGFNYGGTHIENVPAKTE
jgi:hypothetical protein